MVLAASLNWNIDYNTDTVYPYNIVDSAGAGTFTITVNGTETSAITYSNNTSTLIANINARLDASFGNGNVVASGQSLRCLVLTFIASYHTSIAGQFATIQTTVTSVSSGSWTVNGNSFAAGTVGTIYLLVYGDYNGGGFTPSSTLDTTLYATSGTSATPLVRTGTGNHIFTIADTGSWLFVKFGSNWYSGWYQIIAAPVLTSGCIVNAQAGAGYTYAHTPPTTISPTTVQGIGSVDTLGTGSWTIDRSSNSTPWVIFDGTTNYMTGLSGTTSSLIPKIFGYHVTKADVSNSFYVPPNVINMPSGRYNITAATVGAEGAQSWTLVGTNTGLFGIHTAGPSGWTQAYMGGSLVNPDSASIAPTGYAVAGNKTFIKYNSNPYKLNNSISFGTGTITNTNRWIGYNTNRSQTNKDSLRPTIKLANNNNLPVMINISANSTELRNLILDINNSTATNVVLFPSVIAGCLYNIRITSSNPSTNTRNIITLPTNTNHHRLIMVEIDSINNGSTTIIGGVGGVGTLFDSCSFHNNTTSSTIITTAGTFTFYNCLIYNNIGATALEYAGTSGPIIRNCIFYNNTNGVSFLGGTTTSVVVINCIACNNSTADWILTSGNNDNDNFINCAGTRSAITFTNGWYDFITLTSDPFVDGANGNFALKSSGPQYALLKACGFPLLYPAGLTKNYLDIGVAQHEDSPPSTLIIRNQIVR